MYLYYRQEGWGRLGWLEQNSAEHLLVQALHAEIPGYAVKIQQSYSTKSMSNRVGG